MSETRLRLWLLTINDAPLRCGFCDEIIIGSGTGTVHVLLEAIERHAETCEQGLSDSGGH
jgi:hypothetical protein